VSVARCTPDTFFVCLSRGVRKKVLCLIRNLVDKQCGFGQRLSGGHLSESRDKEIFMCNQASPKRLKEQTETGKMNS
jgi:hypothetical protein